jgi:tetratricopeptide (TPR) repeat protein
MPDAEPGVRADWFAFLACVAGRFRDFDTAEYWLGQAEAIAPDRPWICIERMALLEMEDRFEEALASARRALELRPWYRPGVMATAHALQVLGRDQDALELLTEAADRIENGPVVAQLAVLQTELRRHADSQRSIERFVELSPLMEKDFRQWVNARRSDTAYYLGDFAKALEYAKLVDNPFHKRVAEKLAESTEGKRVFLEVGFVRQHYMTCAPATLSAISRYWGLPADHLEVAEAICYDGTPDHSERHWAEQQGYAVREFSVTWESATALLDRELPFTLTTVETVGGHLQACIGYDSRRGTLIIRDPNERIFGEFIADKMLERYRATGPRGMVFVPKEKAHLLEGIDLPDAAVYDQYHRLQRLLQEHKREAAQQAYATLQADYPDHRLTVQARRALGSYDGNTAEILSAVEELLQRYPDDASLQGTRLSILREVGRREDRLSLLKELCEQKDADPYFWQCYAQELTQDARQHDEAWRLLRRVIRWRPTTASGYYFLANILWGQRKFPEAGRLYRLAACLDDTDERLSQAYFNATRHLNKVEAAIQMLQGRFRRFGKKSSQPARTLFWGYSQLDRMKEAFTILKEAIRLRSDDGELMLFAAEEYGRSGDFGRAWPLLQSSKDKAARASRMRAAATLSNLQGELKDALRLWREVIEIDPLALDAHRAVVRLLAETDSRDAALTYLKQTCTKFPHHFGLYELWIEWLRDDGPEASEGVIQHLIANHPGDGWAHREHAVNLAELGRHDEAAAELLTAYRLDPTSVSFFLVKARVCSLAGKPEEAKDAFRSAIRLAADCEPAIHGLLDAEDTLAERQTALAFIEKELTTQAIFGEGILAYHEVAQNSLEPEELLTHLRRMLKQRPELWHAWSALIRQLTGMKRIDDALSVAKNATGRFPLLPRLWYDLAMACGEGKKRDEQVAALERALQINPGWGLAARELATVYEKEGNLERAGAILEKALKHAPLEASNHGCLADMLWQLEKRDAAVDRLQHALRLDPGYDWAWGRLRDWATQLERPQMAVDFVRDMTTRRSGEARIWIMLARTLSAPQDLDERLAALDKAIKLQPLNLEAYDLKAELLAQDKQFDEALTVCKPGVWSEEQRPLLLRGRAAWVQAERGDLPAAIGQMQAILKEDPNYYWGWANLADWQNRTRDFESYLESAEHMARLAPDSPVPFGYRGEAKLRLDRRAEAKADFQTALEIAPDYTFAGLSLFDEQLADGELEAAEETLNRVREHVAAEFVMAREVQLAAKQQNEAAACDSLRQLVEFATDNDWPFNAAYTAISEAGWDEQLDEILASAQESEGVNALALAVWVERWQNSVDWEHEPPEEAELKSRLGTLSRAVRLNPEDSRGHDLKAELLARAGRFDEALAACKHKVWEGKPPLMLRGRAAWIEAQRGDLPQAIRKMLAVTEEDPDYYWGWSNLADWHNRTQDWEAFLHAANHMVRLAPDTPVPFGYRGEALLKTGDRDAAMADFRHALDIAPDYTFAGLYLFDEHLAQDELDQADEALSRIREHVPPEFSLARDVQLQAKRQDEEGAAGALQQLLETETENDWCYNTAYEAMTEAGWEKRLTKLLADARKSDEVNPLALAIAVDRWQQQQDWDNAAPDNKEVKRHLALIDAAIARQPEDPRAHDTKAELLARVGEYDDALAACKHDVWEGKPPPLLRGRAAWIEALRGNMDKAISRMKAVVADEPDYYWGWCRLADWYNHLGKQRDYLKAAEKMAQLSPNEPTAFGYLGEARLNNDDRNGAKEAYRQALAIAPDYLFAGTNLFDLALEDKDFATAEEALTALKKQQANDGPVLAREIRLLAARGNRKGVLEPFSRLCVAETIEPLMLLSALEELDNAGFAKEARKALDEAVFADEANPILGEVWVRACVANDDWRCEERIDELIERGVIGVHAAVAYANALGKAKDQKSLRKFVKRYENEVRENTWSWGQVGSAFGEAKDFQRAAQWMEDYEDRDDAEPWMLINLALHMRELGMTKRANKVNRRALELMAKDPTVPYHALWLVIDDALAGETDAAIEGLESIDASDLDAYHLYLRELVEAVLDVQTAQGGERKQAFTDAKRRLADAVSVRPIIDQGDGLKPTYQRVVRRLAADVGGLGAKIWAWYRCRNPIVPTVEEAS